MLIVNAIVMVAAAYLLLGAGFACAFVGAGVGRVEAGARGAGWGFRVLMVPAAAALWPYLGVRWVRAMNGRGGEAGEAGSAGGVGHAAGAERSGSAARAGETASRGHGGHGA